MAFRIDLIGSGGTEDANGVQMNRVVEGTPDAAHTASDIWLKFLQELDAAGLTLFSQHPDFPGIQMFDRPFTISGDVVRVTLKYRYQPINSPFEQEQPPPDNSQPTIRTLEFATRRVKGTTHFDAANILQNNTVSAPVAYSGARDQTKEIDYEKGVGVITESREELTNPAPRLRAFANTVNAGPQGPYAAETLLFKPTRSTTDNLGQSYSTVYRFDWDEDGHGKEITWTLANNKEPDTHDGGSRRIVIPYRRSAWTGLDIDFSD
jgi:hypothetical protein